MIENSLRKVRASRHSRLRHEVRTGQNPYDLTYTYDQLGNRLTKVDALSGTTATYTYDVSDPLLYGSKNNRLVEFTVNQTGGPVLETVWYAYDAEGNVTRKIRNPAGTNSYTATLLVYNSSKQVEYTIGEAWTSTSCPSYTRTYAWRFRYDGARQRYMRQQLNPVDLAPLSTSWSDYDDDEIYDDFTVAGGTATVTRAYESGVAELPAGGTALYWQGDLIGSNRTLTGAPASAPPIVRRRVYTAFGEVISTSGTSDSRYRYAGAWGYQSHDDIPFQHVGFRYYDPESGRFLQRDSIGIFGGLNVYEYVGGEPGASVDPEGLDAVDIRARLWEDAFLRGDEEAGRAIIAGQAGGCVAGLGALGIGIGGYYGLPYAARFLPVRYSGHAVGRMREYGLHHSIIRNAIRYGARFAGNRPRTTVYVYERVVVVRSWWGKVVTVIKKGRNWVGY